MNNPWGVDGAQACDYVDDAQSVVWAVDATLA